MVPYNLVWPSQCDRGKRRTKYGFHTAFIPCWDLSMLWQLPLSLSVIACEQSDDSETIDMPPDVFTKEESPGLWHNSQPPRTQVKMKMLSKISLYCALEISYAITERATRESLGNAVRNKCCADSFVDTLFPMNEIGSTCHLYPQVVFRMEEDVEICKSGRIECCRPTCHRPKISG